MSTQIERLSAQHFEEAMDFINLVFSQAHRPHDFASLLPKIYRPTDEHMRMNLAARVNGRIRGIVGLFPMTFRAGGETFTAGGIGGVSTHPNDRGMGHMQLLMNRAVEEMRRDGHHLSCLSGMRQRYGYFGYEKAGSTFVYQVTKTNISRSDEDRSFPELRFEPLEPADRENIGQARALYERQPVHIERSPEDFVLFLRSWYTRPYIALDGEGRMVGYLAADLEGTQVSEIHAENEDLFTAMVRAWVGGKNGGVQFSIPPWETAQLRYLGRIAENVTVKESYSFLIFDWEAIIRAFFTVKAGLRRLAEGELRIGIDGYGTIGVVVTSDDLTVKKTGEKADIQMSPLAATKLIFGPVPPAGVNELTDRFAPLVDSWFPLPLAWPHLDGV